MLHFKVVLLSVCRFAGRIADAAHCKCSLRPPYVRSTYSKWTGAIKIHHACAFPRGSVTLQISRAAHLIV